MSTQRYKFKRIAEELNSKLLELKEMGAMSVEMNALSGFPNVSIHIRSDSELAEELDSNVSYMLSYPLVNERHTFELGKEIEAFFLKEIKEKEPTLIIQSPAKQINNLSITQEK